MLPGVPDDRVLTDRSMPGAVWFPGTTVNFAEQALRQRHRRAPGADRRRPRTPTRSRSPGRRCAGQVGAFAATLRRLGVQRGDRVAGYLPNVPEAVVAFLGAASIGAVWSSCAPDFGTRAVLDRFAQIEPTVLVAVDGYRFNGKDYDRRDVVAELRAALPSVRTTIAVPRLFPDELPDGALPVGRGGRRRAGAGVRGAAVRPPAVDRLLVRHDRAAEGDRARRTAASCSSSASRRRCTWTSAPATGSSGTPRPPGSCGTSRRRRCSPARPWSSTTARRPTRRSTPCSTSPPAPASPSSAPAPATSAPARRRASGRASGTTSPRCG